MPLRFPTDLALLQSCSQPSNIKNRLSILENPVDFLYSMPELRGTYFLVMLGLQGFPRLPHLKGNLPRPQLCQDTRSYWQLHQGKGAMAPVKSSRSVISARTSGQTSRIECLLST